MRMKLWTAALAAGMVVAGQIPALAMESPDSAGPQQKKSKHEKESDLEKQLRELRELLAKQQAEIDALKAKQGTPDDSAARAAADAKAQADAAAASAAAASSAASSSSSKVDALGTTVTDLKTTTQGLQETVINNQKLVNELDAPAELHYKNVFLKPGGFFAAETVFRTRAMNSDIATPFNSTPYGNSSQYYLSEFNGSARQTRLSLGVRAPFAWGTAGGYVETDFLGAGTSSNNNSTDSYVMRIRSAFGEVKLKNGFSFQGGQMFTLATEVKKGILAGQGAEALPSTIDPNYHIGFNFGRQYALRFAETFASGKANVAVALEESQIIFTGSNAPANFFFGGAGAAGGLYNSTGGSSGGGSAAGAAAAVQNYTDNLAPDMHLKATFDPRIGHYEIGGVLRLFRDRVYAQGCGVIIAAGAFCPAASVVTSTVGTNYTTPGGGVYASARVPVTKFVDVAAKAYTGPGFARYEAANLGDVTVRPSGQLVPLRTSGGLFELILHPTKKLDVFFLGGVDYIQRTTYISPLTGLQVGYAGVQTQNNSGCHLQTAPTSATGYGYSSTPACSGATRYLAEFTPGFVYRFFNSPTKGRFQMQMTYSYLDRMSWQGYTGGSYAASLAGGKNAFDAAQGINNMFHTSFRYYIP